MTTLFLARHGETVWHAEHRYAGSSDVELTDHGLVQADELGAWATRARLSAIVASRCSGSAHGEAGGGCHWPRGAHRPPSRRDRLRVGRGLTLAELDERMPAERTAFRAPSGPAAPMPAGESGMEGVARALPALLELVDEFPHGRVLVVTHATLMQLVLCSLGIDPDRYRELFPVVENCALTDLRFEELDGQRRARLLGFNVSPRG